MTDEPIDLSVEALTGTIYDLCVSPFETILGIKMKIQRLEGFCLPSYPGLSLKLCGHVYRHTGVPTAACVQGHGATRRVLS